MTTPRPLQELQDLIGHEFSYPQLLESARTRRKYREDVTHTDIEENMDPLGTIGDAVLDVLVLAKLYEQGQRDVGKLNDDKKRIIDKKRRSALAEKHNYEEFVWWGPGEEIDKIWKTGPETFDTCIEALVGDVFIDAERTQQNGVKLVDDILNKLGYEAQ